MKTFNFRWLSIILCTALCITFIACENNTPVTSSSSSGGGNSGGTKRDSTNNGEGEEDELVGVITLRLSNDNQTGTYIPNTGIEVKMDFPSGTRSEYLYMNNVNNFEVTEGSNYFEFYDYYDKHGRGGGGMRGYIVDLGERQMNKVKSLPANGWVKEAAILLKHSYIFKYKGSWGFVEYDETDSYPTDYEVSYEAEYYKIVYVLEWILNKDKEIIGATVQYVDWDPNPSNKDSEQQ